MQFDIIIDVKFIVNTSLFLFGIPSSTALRRRCNDVSKFNDDIFTSNELSNCFNSNGCCAKYFTKRGQKQRNQQ